MDAYNFKKIIDMNLIDLQGTLLEKQDEIVKMTKKMNKILDEKAKITDKLNWFRVYGNYIGEVYSNVDAEACGYADGDEEYEENIESAKKNQKVGFYKINPFGIDNKIN
jgi:hypothetical protein